MTINVTLANHAYTTPGTYAVTLSVTNVQGARDSVSAALAVDRYPIARFDGNCTVAGSVSSCTFTDKSIDSTGVIVGWRWDFGDSSLSIKRNPAHQFACGISGPGNCTGPQLPVFLTVTDSRGLVDTITEQPDCRNGSQYYCAP